MGDSVERGILFDLSSILSLMVSSLISIVVCSYISTILAHKELALWLDFYSKLCYGAISVFFLLVVLYGSDSFVFDKPAKTISSAVLGALIIYIITQIITQAFLYQAYGLESIESLFYLGTISLQVIVAFSESMLFHIGLPFIFFRLGGKSALFSGVIFSNLLFGILHYYSWVAVLGKTPPLQIILSVFMTWTMVCLIYVTLKLKGYVNEAFILYGHLLYNLISLSL